MQGIAFQGAFFAASPLMEKAGLPKFPCSKPSKISYKQVWSKGQRVVDDNMRVVKRGFDEVHEIKNKVLGAGKVKKPMARRLCNPDYAEEYPTKRIQAE
jgi:pyruvate-ferredoxin/flavodoxin oxidoreductase